MAAVKKAKKVVAQPAWKQNFRTRETLPDIKAVRTDFLLNFIAIVLVIALSGYLALKEMDISSIEMEVSNLEARVAAGTKRNSESVKLSGEYTKIANQLKEVDSFTDKTIEAENILIELATFVPEEIVLNTVNFSWQEQTLGKKNFLYPRITINGVAFGGSEEGPVIIDNFKNSLSDLATLEGKIDSIDLPSFNRETAQELFTFTIRITLKDITGKADAQRRRENASKKK